VDTSLPGQRHRKLLHRRLIDRDDDDVRRWRRVERGERDESIVEPPIQAAHDRQERQTQPENAGGGGHPPCAAPTIVVA
jgi:hypothetical protein